MVELSTHAHPEDGQAPAEPVPRRPATPGGSRVRALVRWVAEHPAVIVGILAVAAAAWAVIASQRIFPYLSDDHDEGLYLLQAEALANGHLFPPAPEHPDAFLPWLSVLSDGRFVLKYTPVHASILAAGLRLFGSPHWSLGVIAGGAVALSYALAREVLGNRRLAALASAFLLLSPLFLVQSATFLPYCSSLLLLEAFAFTVLRGLRRDRGLLLALSGFLFGVTAFARPFDALLFGVPFGLYFVIVQRRDGAQLLRNSAWFALGAALPLAAMLLYYRAATGSPWRSPFNLLEPTDTLGFGPRRLLPGQQPLPFTPARGWEGVTRHVLLTSFWGFGGLLLVGMFLAGVLRRRMSGPELCLALTAVTYSSGYLFFWGVYGTSVQGSITGFLGPFYFLPLLIPVTVLAAKGFGWLWHRDQAMTTLAIGGMLTVSGYLLVKALQVNLGLSEEDRRLYAPLEAANLEEALVLVPPMWGPHLLHPFAWLRNPPYYDGETVYALDRGESANLALLGDLPGRVAYRLTVHGAYRASPPDPALTTSLQHLGVVERPSFRANLILRNPTADPYVSVSVASEGRKETFVLDQSSRSGNPYQAGIIIRAGAVEWQGPLEGHVVEQVEPDGLLSVSISVGPGDGGSWRPLYQRQMAYAVDGPDLRLLLPGVVTLNELGADPVTIRGVG